MQKTKTYGHLCRKDRDVIYRMKQRGEKQEDIADTIGTSQSTVSRELKRNWQRTVRLSSCSRGMRCTRSLLTMALSFPSTRKSLRNWERRAIFTPLTTAGKKVELRTTTAWCVSTIQKGTDFSEITQADLHKIETELNEPPRKVPGLGTPLELEPKLAA